MFILIAAAAYFEKETLCAVAVTLCLFKFWTHMKKAKLELRYPKKHQLWSEFVKSSKISSLEFEPFLFAPTSHL